jgi:hypothetical protein
MNRESFVFYKSFFEAAQSLKNSERLRFYDALIKYALEGVEPEGSGSYIALYTIAKPLIDANNQRYENGKKGGRPKKPNHNQTETKPKPNHNQTETKPEPNVNGNVNVNVNENGNGRGFAQPSAFVLADGSNWFPPVEKIQEFERAFPKVDVHRELLRALVKHNAMDQRKNVTNIERYVVNWLINAQSDAEKKPTASFADIQTHNTPVDEKFWEDLRGRGGLV